MSFLNQKGVQTALGVQEFNMEKKKVLFIGVHPSTATGNGNMMMGIASQVDREKYEPYFLTNTFNMDFERYLEDKDIIDNIIPARNTDNEDYWGKQTVVSLMGTGYFDLCFFVGADIWIYIDIFDHIEKLKNTEGFEWGFLFPYDLPYAREDWMQWINTIPFPYVYSEFGYNIIKDYVKRIQYFRPPNGNKEIHTTEYETFNRDHLKKNFFQDIDVEKTVILGTIGPNQKRKNIARQMKGFGIARKKLKEKFPELEMIYYIHASPTGYIDINRFAKDYDLTGGIIRTKPSDIKVDEKTMKKLICSFDCLLNCSFQEGLSWTVLEAMLCKTPVIASKSTGHIELLEDGNGILVTPYETDFLNLMTKSGPNPIEIKACDQHSIANAIEQFVTNYEQVPALKEKAYNKAIEWLSGVNDINKILDDMVNRIEKSKNEVWGMEL